VTTGATAGARRHGNRPAAARVPHPRTQCRKARWRWGARQVVKKGWKRKGA
jgi:hypothetical protein